MARIKTKRSPPKPAKKRQRVAKVTKLVIHCGDWSGFQEKQPGAWQKLPRVRNPWVPTDVVTLLKYVCTYGATKAMVDLLRAWLDYRKTKKIEVKVGDYELKIEGPVSNRVLEKRINSFKELIRGATYDDMDVVLPKGASRRMPPQRPQKMKKE